eukprot:Nk52_evm31s252 gene=Nk52_evmTU31s252
MAEFKSKLEEIMSKTFDMSSQDLGSGFYGNVQSLESIQEALKPVAEVETLQRNSKDNETNTKNETGPKRGTSKKNSEAVKRCRQKRRVIEKQKEALLEQFRRENVELSGTINALETEIRYLRQLISGAQSFREQQQPTETHPNLNQFAGARSPEHCPSLGHMDPYEGVGALSMGIENFATPTTTGYN